MTTTHYVMALRKWWAALLLITLLGAGVGLLAAERARTVHVAETTMLVGNVNQDTSSVRASTGLVATYTQMLMTRPFLERTARAMNPIATADEVTAAVRVVPNSSSRLIVLTARDTDPARASRIATALTGQLVAMTSRAQPYATVRVVAPPPLNPPAAPAHRELRVALAALVAFAAGSALALLIDRRRKVLSSQEEAVAVTDLDPIASIGSQCSIPHIPTAAELTSPGGAGYRLLGAFVEARESTEGLVVTVLGADHGADDLEVATHLAATLAQGGRRVLLLDGSAGQGRSRPWSRDDGALLSEGIVLGPGRDIAPMSGAWTELPALLRGDASMGPAAPPARELLGRLRKAVDVIVVATGDLDESPSAAGWCASCDLVLLVAHIQATRLPALRTSAEAVRRLGATAGLVFLNGRAPRPAAPLPRRISAPTIPAQSASTRLEDRKRHAARSGAPK